MRPSAYSCKRQTTENAHTLPADFCRIKFVSRHLTKFCSPDGNRQFCTIENVFCKVTIINDQSAGFGDATFLTRFGFRYTLSLTVCRQDCVQYLFQCSLITANERWYCIDNICTVCDGISNFASSTAP